MLYLKCNCNYNSASCFCAHSPLWGAHWLFLPKRMGKSAEGSRRVVISHTQWQLPLKAHKVVLGSTSPMFHRRNRHPHPLIYVWGLNHHTRTHKKNVFFYFFYLSQMVAVKVHNHILLSPCSCWGHHLSGSFHSPPFSCVGFFLREAHSSFFFLAFPAF